MIIGVLDSGVFINKEFVNLIKAYTITDVINEIKDKSTVNFVRENYVTLEIRDPDQTSIKVVYETIKQLNTNLSSPDIKLIALTYELFIENSTKWIDNNNYKNHAIVKCFTHDNGIKGVLKHLGLDDQHVLQDKYFKYRCFTCFNITEYSIDFCKNCGYKTITRMAFIKSNGKEIPCLKKGYVPKEKNIKDKHGKDIPCEDITSYAKYKYYTLKKHINNMFN